MSFPLWTRGSSPPRADFSRQLQPLIRPYAFSLFRWEVTTLFGKLKQRVTGSDWRQAQDEREKVRIVREYFALGEQYRRLQDEEQKLHATEERPQDQALEAQLRSVEERRKALESQVENILGEQISHTLTELGLREGLVTIQLARAFPPVLVSITPDVFFKFERLPLLLVIAPRDRIEVKTSLFLQPQLNLEQVEQVEGRVDSLGVSSITVPLGGFAAYPSMIPDGDPLPRELTVISHEWVHQYLALRPLGFHYFSSYEMRAINETVADMAGEEIGRAVYERYYAPTEDAPKPAAPPSPPPKGGEPSRPDFGTWMRAIRKEVEARLARGDVAGAESYMEEERKQLVAAGYYVRKLNTAYLSFFGAYAGGGNPYEPGLRQLRERTGSLKEFLSAVERIGKPQDFERVVR